MEFKAPKIEKIYEAITVILDNRIEYIDANNAIVSSSDGSKNYTLSWSDGFDKFYSDDNSSKWQNTIGYPIIAIIIEKKFDGFIDGSYNCLSGVNWSELNKRYNRDYSAAVAEVLEAGLPEIESREELRQNVDTIFDIVSKMKIEKMSRIP
ncbi:MAG: hypothetical protein JJU18_04500 [Oceanicaulis sp.]|nr:hypothetical protein [Oceanicaulis sp.]